MPRRRAITDAQLEALLALPTAEPDLIRHYTLSPADLAVIARRRRPHNRLGFAIQLCALRFPGRLLQPGEVVPREVLVFVADQLDLPPDVLADYAARPQTRYDQLDALYSVYGFQAFTRPDQRELAQWLLPVALTTTSGAALAGLLLEELRRRAIAAPGPSVIERLVATALLKAERHVDRQIDASLTGPQRDALEALLEIHADTALSVLAWTRQATGLAGHRALARLIDQLVRLRSLVIDPSILEGIHTDRRRVLMREGMRLSAQHLKTLAPLRRRAILAVTAVELITRLTDEAIGMFDRLIGGLFRRAERRAAEALQANARAINDKIRLLARLGDALIEARNTGSDAFAAIETVLPWDRFAAAVAEAKKLSREDGPDYAALAAANHAVLRRVGPLFLDSFAFEGVSGVRLLLRAIEVIRVFYAGSRRTLPKNMPIGFIRRGWRPAVFRDNGVDVATYELCLFAELRDRLRAGDIWVVGSRQYRAVEDQLIPEALFTTMKIAGPLPVAVSSDASVYLQERRTLLDERLREVDGRAGRSLLPDVRITGATLKISPLQATTPEAAEHLAARISALMPRVRITELLAEVSRWTGLADCFTHLRTGLPAEDPRIDFNGRAGRRHQPRSHAHGGGLRHRQLSPARLDGRVAPHRRELRSGARPRRRGPAGASPVGIFRRRSHFQLGRSALPARRAGRGARIRQPAQGLRPGGLVLHLGLRPLCTVLHQGDLCVGGRGGARHRRAALSRRRRRYRRPPHRRRRRLGPRLRALPLAGLSVRAAYSQLGRSAAPYLRSGYHLADARTLHRRKDRRGSDHDLLGRSVALGHFGANSARCQHP